MKRQLHVQADVETSKESSRGCVWAGACLLDGLDDNGILAFATLFYSFFFAELPLACSLFAIAWLFSATLTIYCLVAGLRWCMALSCYYFACIPVAVTL